MIKYNSVFHVTNDCPVEDICDEIRTLRSEDCNVEATWDEHDDETITVTVKGYTHCDELTFNYTPDTIQEQIDKLKHFQIVPDFEAVTLGGYSPDY